MNLMNLSYRTSHFMVKSMLNMMKLPTPPTLTGPGMIRRFPEIVALCGVHKALIVTNTALEKAELLHPLMASLNAEGIEAAVYHMPEDAPSFEDIYNGLDLYYQENCDGIIAFGGGTCIDCGKIIAAKVTNDRPIPKMKGFFKLSRRLPPFFAVPTTAGSGAEATIDALILDTTNCDKFTISDPRLAPLAVVLDPELTAGLSREETLYGALDTLTRAIEAALNHFDHHVVMDQAQEAVCAIFHYLELLLEEPANLTLRQEMLMATHQSGLAKTRAFPGYAQAMAHTLSAWYHLPESRITAVLLPHILAFNLESSRKKLAKLSMALDLGKGELDEFLLSNRFIEALDALYGRLEIPRHLPQIHHSDIPEMARQILKEAGPYPVPRIMTLQECITLLETLQSPA